MAQVITVLGAIIGLVFLVYSIYRGVSPVLASIISVFIVIVTSGAPFQESFNNAIAVVGGIVSSVGPALILGNMMGMIYSASGVCLSMGKLFTMPCKWIKDPLLQKVCAVALLLIVRIVIGLSGIDATALIVPTVALAMAVFSEYDISTRYIPALTAMVGCFGNMMPGVPGMYNLLAVQWFEGYTAGSAMGIRMLLLVIYFALSLVVFAVMSRKDSANDIHFTPSTKVPVPDIDSMKLPPWWFGLLPILVTYITYNFCGFESWSSLSLGLLVSLVFLAPYIQASEGKGKIAAILDQLNTGSLVFPLQWFFIVLPTMAMTQTGGLDIISNGLTAIGLPIILTVFVLSLIVMGFGGSQCMPVIAGLMPMCSAVGLSSVGVALIALWGSTVFDTLPNSGGLLIATDLVDMPMNKSYPFTFYTTVLLTFGMTIVVTLLAWIGIF